MTESMKYYESIRRKYPEAVSKDQFYQIAHISKATALHLLQNGLVPCKDTGKKTRRYTIRTDDIIFYLIDRELHPEVYRAPDRWYQERSGHYNSRVTYRNELTRLSEEERASFRKYMEDEFCQYGDLLTIVEVAEAIGYWRQTLAELCNAKFAEKGLDVSIDHRSYERQGVELLPTVHEGATVRAMEKKGIRTEKGEFNRWIKATNAVIRDIKKKIALLFDWIAEAKVELAKPQAPDLVSLLNAYYTQRRAGAYSQKGKISNLKEMNETFNYLRRNGIYSLEDLESRVSEHSAATESLKKTLDEQTARMKAIKRLYDSSAAFQNLKPVYDGLQKIKLEKPRAKYKAEHEAELIQFYAARRKLTGEFPDGKVDMKKLSDEYDELEQAHNTTYGEFKTVRDDLHRLWKVKSCVDTAARFNERTEEQKLQNRPQTRQKKEDMTR